MQRPSSSVDVSRSWKPDLAGVTEVFHACFTEHTYPLHCHDTWTLLLVDCGAVRYDLDKHQRAADTSLVTVLPPFVAHDGRSATAGRRFDKRVLYIDPEMISEDLVGAAVDRSSIDDPTLRDLISRLHWSFGRPRDELEQESMLTLITARITRALGRSKGRQYRHSSEAAVALLAVLDDDPFRRLSLDDIASELGWNTTHLIRSFTKQFGLPPHRYLISRRIDEARRQLIDGTPPADVATNVGFHDQAHLGKHFKTHVGTTPGRFQRNA